MKKKLLRSLLFSLMLLVSALPYSVFAQTDNATSSAPGIPLIVTPPNPSQEGSSTPPQGGSPVQGTIGSSNLENAANPQGEQALNDAIEVIDNATAEMEAEIVIEATSTEPTIEVVPQAPFEVIETIDVATTTEVAELDREILEPKKEYTFAINGASIPTEGTPEWVNNVDENSGSEKVTNAPAINVGDASHLLNVSGSCLDNYYVILIYKDAEGYNTNPSSYIYNRAYPCENGQYSYELSELPFDLETGTFYLLVAGQGNTGPWKPISAMMPIGVTVKTILPPSLKASTTPNEPTE